MSPYRIALAAAICLTPMVCNATVYRLDAVVNGTPQAFGTINVDPAIVASGELDLTKTCPQFGPCNQAGPWDQVSFDLAANLQKGVTSTGPGAIADISLLFGAGGDVAGGSIKVEAPEGGPGVAFLRASLGPSLFATDPLSCSAGSELCGTYIPVSLADPLPVSITFVQQVAPIPEPHIGLPVLFGGLVLALLAGGTKPASTSRPDMRRLGEQTQDS